jgi:hypothetical protein
MAAGAQGKAIGELIHQARVKALKTASTLFPAGVDPVTNAK